MVQSRSDAAGTGGGRTPEEQLNAMINRRSVHDKNINAEIPGMSKCNWCSAVLNVTEMQRHLDTGCPSVPIQCALKDTELLDECTAEVKGRENFRAHRAVCTFQPIQCPNAPRCKALVSKRSMKIHLETCVFQKTACLLCGAKYYRADEDYHSSACPEAKISCPLLCGKMLRRSDLNAHFKDSLLEHSYTNLESEVYLPPDHPSMVYAALLKIMKELKIEANLAKSLGHGQVASDSMLSTESKTLLSPARAMSPPRPTSPMVPGSPLHDRAGSPPRSKTAIRDSSLPPQHVRRFDDCLDRINLLSSSMADARRVLDKSPQNPSHDTMVELMETQKLFVHEYQDSTQESETLLNEMDALSTYIDPNGRRPPQVALDELTEQRRMMRLSMKNLDLSYDELRRALDAKQWQLTPSDEVEEVGEF